jgi:hypothetical protein
VATFPIVDLEAIAHYGDVRYEAIQSQTPDEPPKGSVVLDPSGAAWQRHGSQWRSAGASIFTGGVEWPLLITRMKHLTLIYRAPANDQPAATANDADVGEPEVTG